MKAYTFGKALFLGILAVLLGAGNAIAQSGTNVSGNGGKHTIQGSIYLPSGNTPDGQVSVSLQSNTFTSLTVLADKSGAFAFRNLLPGTYSVVVDAGQNFEIARETIVIDPDPNVAITRTMNATKVFTVPVYLQQKSTRQGKAGIVLAKLADVPKEAVKLYEKAIKLGQENKLEEANKELKAALLIHPNFPYVLAALGVNYLRMAKLNEAIESLEAALKLEPDYFDAKLNLGIAYLNKKQFDDAEKKLSDAITQNATAVTPHYYLGIVFLQKQDLDKAKAEFEIAKKTKTEKELPLVHKYLGGIYWQTKQYDLAVVELQTYLKLAPDAKDADKIRQTIKELKSL